MILRQLKRPVRLLGNDPEIEIYLIHFLRFLFTQIFTSSPRMKITTPIKSGAPYLQKADTSTAERKGKVQDKWRVTVNATTRLSMFTRNKRQR